MLDCFVKLDATDHAGRLSSLSHGSFGGYGFSYDADDRITTFTIGSADRTFTYDADGQLTNDNNKQSFTYDPNGNRQIHDNDSYTTGKDNRLSSDGTYTYRYDPNGNREAKLTGSIQFNINAHAYEPTTNGSSAVTYAYDLRNRLVAVTSKTKTDGGDILTTQVVYTYDVNDNRTSKDVTTDDPDATEVHETYAYDGSDLTSVFADGDLSEKYLYDDAGQPLGQDEGGSMYWLLGDHQGSIRKLISATGGATAATYDYDAYGNSVGGVPDRFGYTGYVWNPEVQLWSTRGIRLDDSATGTFISRDPAASGTNLFEYVDDDPTNKTDRYGLFASEIYGATSGGAVTGSFNPFVTPISNGGAVVSSFPSIASMPLANGNGTANDYYSPEAEAWALIQASQQGAASHDSLVAIPGHPNLVLNTIDGKQYMINGVTTTAAAPAKTYSSGIGGWIDQLWDGVQDRFGQAPVAKTQTLSLSPFEGQDLVTAEGIYEAHMVQEQYLSTVATGAAWGQKIVGGAAKALPFINAIGAGYEVATGTSFTVADEHVSRVGAFFDLTLTAGPALLGVMREVNEARDIYRLTERTSLSVHNEYLNFVRPGAQTQEFGTAWSSSSGLGSRVFDDFDRATKTGFEANTTPWTNITSTQLSRKLDQLGSDMSLLHDPRSGVDRVIWFGTHPLPQTGAASQLKSAIEEMQQQEFNIRYYHVPKQ